MNSDIQIARETPLRKIKDVAENIGINREEVIGFGRHMAKIPLHLIDQMKWDFGHMPPKTNHLFTIDPDILRHIFDFPQGCFPCYLNV